MSDARVIFLCSLPGAGGMLLHSILSENPAFHAIGHSPLLESLHALNSFSKQVFSDTKESSLFSRHLMTGMLDGAASYARGKILIDKTGTGPLEYLDIINSGNKRNKVILFIRDLRTQVANLILRNINDEISGVLAAGRVLNESIIKGVLSQPAISLGLKRIVSYLKSPTSSDIFILSYEQLCVQPGLHLELLYSYLELPCFKHNLNEIKAVSSAFNFSANAGIPEIRPRLSGKFYNWQSIISSSAIDWIIGSLPEYFGHFYPETLNSNPFRLKDSQSIKDGN